MSIDHPAAATTRQDSFLAGVVSIGAAGAPGTYSAYAALYADLEQFADPDKVLRAVGGTDMEGRDDTEILVADASVGVTLFSPQTLAETAALDPDLSMRFSDPDIFDDRIPELAQTLAPFLGRPEMRHGTETIGGIALIGAARLAPGFEAHGAILALMDALHPLAGGGKIAVFHSEQDLCGSEPELWGRMRDLDTLRRSRAPGLDTFPRLGPLAGCMMNLVGTPHPGGMGIFSRVPCAHDIAVETEAAQAPDPRVAAG